MFEVELTDGTALQAYKHIDTRRYVHLAPDGAAVAFAAVFAPLPCLAGVTEEQIVASSAAVERLTHRDV
ncbi:MAG: hypothetical protein ACRDSN_18500 [Pseudonocardiaceae bacterium]